jgi:hypothetical protein
MRQLHKLGSISNNRQELLTLRNPLVSSSVSCGVRVVSLSVIGGVRVVSLSVIGGVRVAHL